MTPCSSICATKRFGCRSFAREPEEGHPPTPDAPRPGGSSGCGTATSSASDTFPRFRARDKIILFLQSARTVQKDERDERVRQRRGGAGDERRADLLYRDAVAGALATEGTRLENAPFEDRRAGEGPAADERRRGGDVQGDGGKPLRARGAGHLAPGHRQLPAIHPLARRRSRGQRGRRVPPRVRRGRGRAHASFLCAVGAAVRPALRDRTGLV